MKKLIFILAALLVAASAYAVTSEFVINSTSRYNQTTKNTVATVPVSYTTPTAFQTAGTGCRVFQNATSSTTGFPVNANTMYKLQTTNGTNNLVFKCYTATTIFVMK